MNLEKKLITPSIAKDLLESNVKNRNVRKNTIARYASEMIKGNWKEDTFELIKISKTGIILDGQHRLLAVIKANTPIYFHIAYGLDDNIFDVLDTGSNRSSADVLHINNVKNSTIIPSIIQLYFRLKKNKTHLGGYNRNETLSNSDILKYYSERPEYFDNLANTTKRLYLKFAKILAPQTIGAMLAYLGDISSVDALEFMEQLCSGENVTNTSIYILRNKLIEDRTSTKKIPLNVKYALIIKVWNNYRKGVNGKHIKFAPEIETMPIAI